MASNIDISNLALAHLGDDATVLSLNPPDGSAQAEHCARFYPIARDSLLEQHDWNFATRRAALTPVTLDAGVTQFGYAYAMPNTAVKIIALLPPGAGTVAGQLTSFPPGEFIAVNAAQDFVVETDPSGNSVILSNQSSAFAIFTVKVTDTTKFSPLFVDTLSWYLASYLAGPILKGETGRAEAKACMQIAMMMMGRGTYSDANQRQSSASPNPDWVANR